MTGGQRVSLCRLRIVALGEGTVTNVANVGARQLGDRAGEGAPQPDDRPRSTAANLAALRRARCWPAALTGPSGSCSPPTCTGITAERRPVGFRGVGNSASTVRDAQGGARRTSLPVRLHQLRGQSRRRLPLGCTGPDRVVPAGSERIRDGRRAGTTGGAGFHAPLPECAEGWATRPCRGTRYESVCCPRASSGPDVAFLGAGDVVRTSAGHDHVNDYEGDLHGIRLCCRRGSGFDSYRREGSARGARVIEILEGVRGFRS